MTVAYAALTQTLNINGSAKVQNVTSSLRVRFKALTSGNPITTSGYATVPNNAALSFTDDSTVVTLPQVTLKAPGDKVTFKWTVANTGDINAKLTGMTAISKGTATYDANETLTSDQKTALENDIQVTFKYADGTTITPGTDTLAKTNGARDLMVTVEYVKTESVQTLPSHDVTFSNITAALVYGQDTNS